MKYHILLILVFFLQFSYSQTIIKGKITVVSDKSAVDGVNISLYEEEEGTIKSYTITDEKGNYEIRYNSNKDSLLIRVSGFNMKNTSKKIANRNQNLNFEIEEESIQLREVVVKAQKIRQTGDTINYLVSEFSDATDRSIGDVLKKLPGIRVADDGTVFYQNLPINKYYIENLDLLQGRYGIANNNIKASDISTVQVLENHQPIKALKDIDFSDRAAINLKLKESAKGAFFADLTAGIGLPALLLNNSVVGMRFSRTVQNLIMYKGDNTGRNTSDELKSFYNNDTDNIRQLLNIQKPSQPAISQQRFLFNNTHLGSVNDIHKLNEDYTFTTNINYSFDKPEKTSTSIIEYFLPEQNVLRVEESLKSIQIQNKLNMNFLLNANNENFYLNNNLKLGGNWNRETGDVLTPTDTVSQKMKSPEYSVSNNFEWVRKTGNRRYEIHSFAAYNRMSQLLQVTPWLYEDIFPDLITDGKAIQNVHQSNFVTRNRINFGENRFNLSMYFNAELQNMKTDLFSNIEQNTRNGIDSLCNNLLWNRFEWQLHNFYGFDLNSKISIYFGIPLRYVWLYRNNRIQNKHSGSGFFYIEPYLHINYQITPAFSAICMYGNTNNLGGISNAYDSYVMTSYKEFTKNDGYLDKERLQNIFLLLSYKNPLSTLFGSFSANYSYSWINLLDNIIFQGIMKIISSIEQPHAKKNFSTSATIGKDIESIRSKISINTAYSNSKSAMISQTLFTIYRSNIISLSSYLTTRLGTSVILNYEMKYSLINSKIDLTNQDLPVIQTFSQLARINYFPVKNLSFSFSAEQFYNNRILLHSRSIAFGDFGIKYIYKNTDIILEYTNIFNAKQYIYNSYSDISRHYYSYNLRPSEILLRLRHTIR